MINQYGALLKLRKSVVDQKFHISKLGKYERDFSIESILSLLATARVVETVFV
jgi:hypothetical protein